METNSPDCKNCDYRKTLARSLEKEDVRKILMDILGGSEFYGLEDKRAEHIASYTAGVLDMANAVIEAINEFGGK